MAVFLVGLVAQVAALPLRGTADVRMFKEWGVSALTHGLFSAYSAPAPRPDDYVRPDYPPLSLTLLTATAAAMEMATGRADVGSRALTFYIKLLTLIATLMMFGLMLALVTRWTRDESKALAVATAFWINPALWVNGPVLGYLDSLCWLVGVLVVVCASMNRPGAAAMLAVVAVLIKPQGVFFLLPVAIVAWGNWARVARTASIAVAVGGAIIAPFVLFSGPVDFASTMKIHAFDDTLSGNALNLWWLATLAFETVGHAREYSGFSDIPESHFASVTGIEPRLWMAIVVVGFAGWLGWLMRGVTQLSALAAYLALVLHVYFVFAISVHENHQVYAVVMLGLVAVFEPSYRPLLAAVSGLTANNMVLFYGVGRDFPTPPANALFFAVTASLSIVNILLLVVHARLFRRMYDRMTPGVVTSRFSARRLPVSGEATGAIRRAAVLNDLKRPILVDRTRNQSPC